MHDVWKHHPEIGPIHTKHEFIDKLEAAEKIAQKALEALQKQLINEKIQ